MKTRLLPRMALLACIVSAASMTPILAQDDSTSSTPAAPACHHHRVLTKAERQELKKDKEQVMASNADLQTEGKTLHQEMREHRKKVDAAIVQLDSNAAPLLAKLEAAHQHHHHPDSGAGPDSSSGSSN